MTPEQQQAITLVERIPILADLINSFHALSPDKQQAVLLYIAVLQNREQRHD